MFAPGKIRILWRTPAFLIRIKAMNSARKELGKIARQLLETEESLGNDFLPAGRPLPPSPADREPKRASLYQSAIEVFTDDERSSADVPKTAVPPIGASMTRQQKIDALAKLQAEHLAQCGLCSLCQTRTQTVFGEGDAEARLVFVGEAPGAEEDRTGRPFVGRAGELLGKMIVAMGLKREEVYICNIIKCRPPDNRTPDPAEMAACMPYLVRQLQILAPAVIVTLGNPATQSLLDTKTGITRLRGQWQKLPDIGEGLAGIDVMPTFHPAYVLRNYNEETRGKVWDDLKKVMDRLGLKRKP